MKDDQAFFIGWESRIAPSLRRFLLPVAGAVLAGFLVLAAVLGVSADDPAGPRFAQPPGPGAAPADGALRGVLTMQPYPVLHLPADAAHPRGRAVLLAGDGKIGLPGDAAALEGRTVLADGYWSQRGSIAMMALGAAPTVVEGDAPPPPAVPLGRWRIAGEICDGKCASGVMRPGTGISHRACATLCLQGLIPAVFVATGPVAGSAFLLLADQDGRPGFDAFRHLIGLRIVLEGEVERRGDMLVLRADFAQARVP